MFGLTRREQRWKEERKAAELIVTLVSTVVTAAAAVRKAEVEAQAKADALELEQLRTENARLEKETGYVP